MKQRLRQNQRLFWTIPALMFQTVGTERFRNRFGIIRFELEARKGKVKRKDQISNSDRHDKEE